MKTLVKNAREYLLSFNGISTSILDNHLENWRRLQKDTLNDLYKALLNHAKNRQSMPNTIGDIERLNIVFFNFDPIQVSKNYQTYRDVLHEISCLRIPTSGIIDPENQKSHWVIFSKAALSSANFLSKFETSESFHRFVQSFYVNQFSRVALPLLLKEEIFGFGFALACDFLKECGYNGFIKPDTHFNDICRAANITDATTDYGVFKDAILYCEQNKMIPYEFDKLIWLVGSGNFYLNNLKISTNKNDFIKHWINLEN